MESKAIRMDYYEVWEYKKMNNNTFKEQKMNIANILVLLEKMPIQERTFEYGGEKIRFQEIVFDSENKTWEIQLLRARNTIIPGVADDSGNYTIMKLENNKYYAESISVLYNESKCLIAFQINHNYVTRSLLQQIFNKFQKDLDDIIELRPIIIKDKKEKVENAKYYTKLNLIVKKTQKQNDLLNKDKSLMGNILSSANKYEGAQIEISIGFGRRKKKNDTLNIEQIKETINYANQIDGIESLQIDYKTDEDSLLDSFNLIKERVQDWIYIQKEKNSPILHKQIIKKMKEKFIKRINSGIM